MKRILLLTLTLLIACTGTLYAKGVNGQYDGYDVVKVQYNGTELKPASVPGILYKGTTLVPIGLLRQAGFNVGWNQQTLTANIKAIAVEPTQPELTKVEIQNLMNRLGKVSVYNTRNQKIANASGFLLSNSMFVTNFHVGSTGTMKIDFNDGQSYTTKGGNAFSDASTDVYGVYLGTESQRPQQYLEYSTELPKALDKVYLLSNPKGSSYVLTECVALSIAPINGTKWIQHSCAEDEGSSGGALLNKYGEVIGIHSWVAQNNENIKYASPISNVIASIK